ncbi:hypothetical protein TSAR_001336 [Trichomalopsis sarcophagae]|uniref:DUF4794 domain-containing protein n=1 Tax=Trichomalopsis sarcophagae TaxID=543379 RepID=A0A232FJE6_9HYME|nr:hypothetical protein TSAR_001336 [Trichomalopsis sarcophagae]
MRDSRFASALLVLLVSGGVFPAVVLPRPPSSPNYIPQEYAGVGQEVAKGYNAEKAMYQSTNVEKPDTQDYRFLEIEVRDADNVDSLDLHGLVQAVLDNRNNPQHSLQSPLLNHHRLDLAAEDEDDELEERRNQTYPHPEVVPHSILGVRDVGLGPSQRLFEPTSLDLAGRPQHYLISPPQATKNLGDEKLYYLKSGRPKVYVNFRGKTGNFRQDTGDSRVTMRFEPSAFLRATQPYQMEKKTKSPKSPPKKYNPRLHGSTSSLDQTTESTASTSSATTTASTTTENAMVTSSELPKQIPAPPSRIPSRSPIAHTTPVQRYTARRTDILPGYAFADS